MARKTNKLVVRKWEMVVGHLRQYKGLDKTNAQAALEWAKKWPNARSRDETALAATVVSVIKKRILNATDIGAAEEASETLADLVAREARVRVVASVQRRGRLSSWAKPVVARLITEALEEALRRGLKS